MFWCLSLTDSHQTSGVWLSCHSNRGNPFVPCALSARRSPLDISQREKKKEKRLKGSQVSMPLPVTHPRFRRSWIFQSYRYRYPFPMTQRGKERRKKRCAFKQCSKRFVCGGRRSAGKYLHLSASLPFCASGCLHWDTVEQAKRAGKINDTVVFVDCMCTRRLADLFGYATVAS